MSSKILEHAMQLAALGLAVDWLRSPTRGGQAPSREVAAGATDFSFVRAS